MPIYHYAIMDYTDWYVKIWTIEASEESAAYEHLQEDDNHVMISPNKIKFYKNKTILSTNESDDA